MTARIPPRDPNNPWYVTLNAIAAYLQTTPDEAGDLLRSGELRGEQRSRGGKWRTHLQWMDAYMAGEEPQPITSRRLT